MAITNRDRVGRAMDALAQGLKPFVEREMDARAGKDWRKWLDYDRDRKMPRAADGSIVWDGQSLLQTMVGNWKDVFGRTLSHGHRALVGELIDVRNAWAHQEPFSYDDTHRALDSVQRLLGAISAGKEAEAVEQMRQKVLRTMFQEQARTQTRRQSVLIEAHPQAGLLPWREVVTPHPDVAAGRYVQAQFAADLAQVHRGQAAPEYQDPAEFFRRTYLTDGLKRLLAGAVKRLTGRGGDPVIELQTNFGGGKTHSLLALFHLASGRPASELPGIEPLLKEHGLPALPPSVERAVFVGTNISPGQPQTKPDGTRLNTIWGDLAWQLAKAEGVELVAEADRTGTNPGAENLVQLFQLTAPCIILIDEWIAYVRQLYGVEGLPGGSFDANLTFAQALTEAARAVDGVVLLASLPESDIEIGGEGSREALRRLQNVFARMESPWRAASIEESFEIVRRRLFEPIGESRLFAARDAVINAFSRLYQTNAAEFPPGVGEGDYRRRMTEAYPIHPELFERLYYSWGSLERFQRTRGVLRLMASVIHTLWERNDPNLLILPSSVPLDEPPVQSELTRYTPQGWDSVIGQDVDGPHSLPLALDRENPNLGRFSATRRVARTIYMGSAPVSEQSNAGIDDRAIKLGCVQPGEVVATFGDALRRLADRATYLYVDGQRYWYMTKPSVGRMAEDRAAALDIHDVRAEIEARLRRDANRGEFAAVHVAPASSGDVPDEMEARLVVIGPERTHRSKGLGQSDAHAFARKVLEHRGTAPRLYRNMLVFLAADATRLEELVRAARKYLAWKSILEQKDRLDLTTFQLSQAQASRDGEDDAIKSRINESWTWLLVPVQPDPLGPVEWEEIRVQGQDPIAVRASRKLVNDETLITRLGPTRLRMNLDRIDWDGGERINTGKLWEHLASYVYLARLKDRQVLARAIEEGLRQPTGDQFAYAEAWDEAAGRYRGVVRGGAGASVAIDSLSVLIKPEAVPPPEPPPPPPTVGSTGNGDDAEPPPPPPPAKPRRFYATVDLDPDRAGRDMGQIAEEVLQHLTTCRGSEVRVTVEIAAELPDGMPENVQRVVSENCLTLRFRSCGFERS